MRKITIALLLATAVSAGAQTAYDAASIASKDLNGTARFVGMGGAMGALGGDLSTMGVNPAGIGIYRSNDAAFTLGYTTNSAQSNYLGTTTTAGKNRWNVEQAGIVFSTKIGNVTPLRYVNFGFNYTRSNSLYKNMTMEGLMGTFNGAYVSQVRQMAQQATDAAQNVYNHYGEYLDFGSNNIFSDDAAGWLGALGYQGWLIDEDTHTYPYNSYNPIVPNEAYARFHSRERGGVDQYDFNMAFNVKDRFYFGFTVGVYSANYEKYASYDETYESAAGYDNEGYRLNTENRIKGEGWNIKLGAIVRPLESSPLRIGLAVHTPTFYRLTYSTNALLMSDVLLDGATTTTPIDVDTYVTLGNRNMDRDFSLETPWLFNASLGYTVGSSLALGAEYEYEDYSTLKFRYPEGDKMEQETNQAARNLQGVHTLRVGAEYKPVSSFALRVGYNYSTALHRNDAVKVLPINSLNTDTDFTNTKEMNTYTLGIGYRGSSFYADLAYKYQTYSSDFYPFYNEFAEGNGIALVTPQATKVNTSKSQVSLTVGVRF
ncbi:MAG: TonB-dependent receptor [Prevotellaceae bacterium]|jgi:hypothetical protein|nr:TonB-dependent receptor [Prevotellaceae bacterium]